MEKIEADLQTLKKIFNDDERFYQIPDYQRPYSWDKDNISELIDDLVDAFINNYEEDYFCGSLVLVENDTDKRFDIIDGQQRVTTFTILACVVRDLFFDKLDSKAKNYINRSIQDEYDENKRKLRFLTNEQNQVDFEQTILKGISFKNTKKIEKDLAGNKYLQNAHFIKLFLTEKISDEKLDINSFIIWIYEKIVLTVITTPSLDNAIRIFNVLNNRGMPLSPMDILKSALMTHLSAEDRNAFKRKWEDINQTLSITEFDFEDLLNTYLYYKITSNPNERYDKVLLDIFKAEKTDPLSAIFEIENFSNAYLKTVNTDDKYLYCLKYLRHRVYWHSIIATAYFVDYSKIEDLKKILVAYYFQNWIAGATVARIKHTSFNILKLVKNKKDIEEIKKECSKNLDYYETSKTFREELRSPNVYGRNWDRAVLLLLEYFSQDNSSLKFIPLNNSLQVEHILPRTITDENKIWKEYFNDNEITELTNSMGNLTLLSMRKNIQAYNYSFDMKKKAYSENDNVITSFVLTQKIINNYKEWNATIVRNRTNEMIENIQNLIDIFTV